MGFHSVSVRIFEMGAFMLGGVLSKKSSSFSSSQVVSLRHLLVSTGVGVVILLMPPVIAWLADWSWGPVHGAGIVDDVFLRASLWCTESASFPFAIITSVVLVAIFALALHASLRGAVGLCILCFVAMMMGQGVKALLKNATQEPRPYVQWVGVNYKFSSEAFYALSRDERAAWLQKNVTDNSLVPEVLRAHWRSETGYSFPSGHTSFVAIWALLGAAILWSRGRGAWCCALFGWAVIVEATRLSLGMHWPRDVAVGVLMSWPIVVCLVWLWQRYAVRIFYDSPGGISSS